MGEGRIAGNRDGGNTSVAGITGIVFVEGTSMADEVFTNALGGILMLLIIQGYLIYLRVKRQRGGLITRPERTIFSAICLISFLAILVYFVRTQVI